MTREEANIQSLIHQFWTQMEQPNSSPTGTRFVFPSEIDTNHTLYDWGKGTYIQAMLDFNWTNKRDKWTKIQRHPRGNMNGPGRAFGLSSW